MDRPSSISVTEPWLTLLFLALASVLALRPLVPPAAVSASAPTSDFSAERAFNHLEFIAREPHPTGSIANSRVRDYLVDQLNLLGVEQEVQKAIASSPWDLGGPPYASGAVQNVIGRMTGTDSSGTVLLMAHYDSVATGPGAGDNGSGVVTLLETARALRSSARLRNDLVVAFTDGEEDGGLGAQAFLDKHRWAKDLSIAVVVDGSGSCGPAALSVFDRHNGWLVRMFAKALPRPLAASISEALYKLAPSTDEHLNLYQKNIPVLDLGVDGCQTTYHTTEDKPANLDARSVQDLGDYELRLMRHFGNLDLKQQSQDDLIYFTLFGHLLFYPSNFVLPFTAAALLVLLSVLLLGLKRKILTARGLSLGFLLWVIGVTAAGGAVAFLGWVLRSMHLVNQSFISAYNAHLFAVAFVGFAAAMASAIYAAASQKVGTQNLVAGALLFCGVLMLVTYAFAPGATYLLTWPLLFALFSMGYAFELHRIDVPSLRVVRVVQLFCAVPALALFVPLIGYMAMTTADVSQSLVIVGFLTLVLFAMLAPQLEVLLARNKALFPGTFALVALIFVVLGASRSGYDVQHPKPDSISYWLDTETGKASWISFDDKSDDWTSQFLTNNAQPDKVDIFGSADGDPVLKAAAPTLSLPPPVIKTLDDSMAGSERTLRLQISSPRGARVLWVIVRNAAVVRAVLEDNNIQVGDGDTRAKLWGLVFIGLPPEGIHLDVTVKASDALRFLVTDQADGLPEVPGLRAKPRSENRMSLPVIWPFFDSATLVSRTFLIESDQSQPTPLIGRILWASGRQTFPNRQGEGCSLSARNRRQGYRPSRPFTKIPFDELMAHAPKAAYAPLRGCNHRAKLCHGDGILLI